MVAVNGDMVPPAGASRQSLTRPQQGGGKVGYSDQNGEPKGTVDAGNYVKWNVKDKERNLYGETVGNNRSLSIKRGQCETVIFMHVHLQEDSAGCDAVLMQATMDKMEKAASKWRGEVKCPEPKLGRRHKKGMGKCTWALRLAWHSDNPKSHNDSIAIKVDCQAWNPGTRPLPGEALAGSGLDGGIRVLAPGKGADPSEGYYAHELGHNLFLGSVPKGVLTVAGDPEHSETWSRGHSPDKGSIMRDTALHGGIPGTDEPTAKDIKALMNAYKICVKITNCCNTEPIPPKKKEPEKPEAAVVAATRIMRD